MTVALDELFAFIEEEVDAVGLRRVREAAQRVAVRYATSGSVGEFSREEAVAYAASGCRERFRRFGAFSKKPRRGWDLRARSTFAMCFRVRQQPCSRSRPLAIGWGAWCVSSARWRCSAWDNDFLLAGGSMALWNG